MVSILWFKRDLRLADHPALAAAQRHGPVVCVYIVEPDYWRLPDVSGRQYDFLRESLDDLRAALRSRGADLVLRVGEAVALLEALRQETGASRLFSLEETGNAWTYARDRAVGAWARGQGVRWAELPQCAVRRGRHDRDDWSKQRNRWIAEPPLPAPNRIDALALRSDPLPDAAALGVSDTCPERQRGGRNQALSLLGGFLTERGRDYRRAMSTPLGGATACSRLSPHLALGSLSVREVAQATAARQREVRGTREGWSGSLSSFQSRLAWRDHFMQKLEDEPPIEWREMHPAYRGLRDAPDDERLDAWARGETGLPFLDACMRSLHATGWLNFRMRSMLMAVASYHLWLPWQVTGRHLARLFTDYEPGIHWSQCQMQSGTTGINTLRIYNPVKQGHDQDPTGAFTRRWVPELEVVPDALLQEPWRWDGPTRYPRPIIDVADAARQAREAIWAVRKGEDFRDHAARVIDRHASRKDRHFVNDRAPRTEKRRQDARQGSFDF
ncbi:FAD-binding domain-containing protein [Thetidibacter halocola]|uniref:Deoxyribodipyrimidine photo-lyase n=1 Tax=Thetidibacter halocola TaxID=2827239 RepID=A0A8J7WD28_9RHOB|nr:FAD-binding domain-containing protein [Thetidibacter halocola]MBS0123158.1 deoxyribodipyrimidine photo-lyase [Thetidibacter halocola]